jgi:hypothetical protein
VGDKRPPKHTRYKPGVSGNPKGRPKGSVGLRGLIAKQLKQMVTVTRNGLQVQMRKDALIARQLVDAAVKGDLKAMFATLRLEEEATVAASVGNAEAAFEPPNKENLRFIAARLRGLIEEVAWWRSRRLIPRLPNTIRATSSRSRGSISAFSAC